MIASSVRFGDGALRLGVAIREVASKAPHNFVTRSRSRAEIGRLA